MVLYLKLDTPRVREGDYGYNLSGSIHTDRTFQTAKVLTGNTLTIRIYTRTHHADMFNKTASINVAADGSWTYTVLEGEMVPDGFYKFEVELDDGSVVESAVYADEFVVEPSPH